MVLYRKRQTKQKSRTDVPVAMIPMPSTDATNNDFSEVEKSPEQKTYQAINDNTYVNWPTPSAAGGNDGENTYCDASAMHESPQHNGVMGGNDDDNYCDAIAMNKSSQNNDGSSPAAGITGGNDDENAYFEPIAMYESPQFNSGSSSAAMKPNPPYIVNKGRHSLMPQ